MSMRDKIRAYRPQKPYRPPPTQEERERNGWRMMVLREWLASGNPRLSAPDGLAQCKTEAARRQEAQSSRISQAS